MYVHEIIHVFGLGTWELFYENWFDYLQDPSKYEDEDLEEFFSETVSYSEDGEAMYQTWIITPKIKAFA